MDDIDAAVEDAEYVKAMRDSVPHPTKDWEWMTPPDLAKHIEENMVTNPEAYTLEKIASSVLGLYLFLKFAKDNGSNAQANFILAVANFKMATDYSLVRDIRHIVEEYLVDGSLGVHDGFPVEWPCRNTTKETLRCTVSPGSSEGSQGSGSIKRGGNNSLKLTGERITGLVASFSERKSPFSVLSPQNSPRKSSLTSPSPSPTPAGKSLLLSPDKTVFDSIEQAVFTALKEKHWNAFMESEEWARYHQFMVMQEQMQRDGLKENKDFFVLRVVGRGGFGQVNACKKATTGKLYAMKQMSKRRIKMKRCESLIVSERDFLAQVHSPYVVNLAYAFSSPTDVYLVLDLMIGGDLSFHLKTRGRFSLRETKYYIARTLLGTAALHDLGVVHRDLKPENILMDVHGRTRISDFGLAATVPAEGLTKCCGTRGYWAPEMIARPKIPYFISSDWFSLGVCLYELLTGTNPFFLIAEQQLQHSPEYDRSQFEAAVDRAILEVEPDLSAVVPAGDDPVGGERKRSVLGPPSRASSENSNRNPGSGRGLGSARRFSATKTPRTVSGAESAAQARDLLQRLLCKDPALRLGGSGGGGGYADIMAHPWFADIDWSALNNVSPPWCPEQEINMKAQSEIGDFLDAKEINALLLGAEDQAHYAGWNYVSEHAFQQEIVDFLHYEELQGPIRPASDSTCCVVS